MSDITPFVFPTTGQAVRTLLLDGEPWFVATDVAAILGYRDAYNATRLLDDDEKGTHLVSTPSGDQLASIISEPGLYMLIMRSNAIGAREFQRWVTHEVLPALRKTGSYSIADLSRRQLAQMVLDAENALEDAENRALAAEHHAREIEPAARAFEAFLDANGDFDAAESAQYLCRDKSISIGEIRLFRYMDSIRWTYKHGKLPRRAYQEQVNLGRLVMKPTTYIHPNTGEQVAGDKQVRITVKGLFELHKRLGGTGDLHALMGHGGDA